MIYMSEEKIITEISIDKNLMKELYSFVVKFLDKFLVLTPILEYKNNIFLYILTGPFINKNFFCHEYSDSISDLVLDIYVNIKKKNIGTFKNVLKEHMNMYNMNSDVTYKNYINNEKTIFSISYKGVNIINFKYDEYITSYNYMLVNNLYILVDANINCDPNDINIIKNEDDIMKTYNENNIYYYTTSKKLKLPQISNKILERKTETIKNIQYLWDYTRHSKTLNINLIQINLGNKDFDYPIIKEESQEDAENVIYQDKNFIKDYSDKNLDIEYLFNGSKITEIEKTLNQVIDDIVNLSDYKYEKGFFCYRMTNFFGENLLEKTDIPNIRDLIGKKIHIPYFMSCFRSLEEMNLDWLLSFNSVLLVIYVNEKIKNYISIDPCKTGIECFFGSENELLFKTGCSLKILDVKKSIIDYKSSKIKTPIFINTILCKIEYDDTMKNDSDKYYKKYIKYKNKYLELKSKN